MAPRDSLAALSDSADEIICLAKPAPFYAVGAHYDDFDQTTDEEVTELLNQAQRFGAADNRRAS